MLVLTRKIGEKIVIDQNITVTVKRVSGNRVALAFEAPDDVRILRQELKPFGGRFADDHEPELLMAPVPASTHDWSRPTLAK
jgi:carbon storage regulator CsrA